MHRQDSSPFSMRGKNSSQELAKAFDAKSTIGIIEVDDLG
jgi:hypothetical protein